MIQERRQLSKYLAYILRHCPQDCDLHLDVEGWVGVSELLQQLQLRKGWQVDMEELEDLVRSDPKGRYTLRNGKIRANQGHSLEGIHAVDLTPITPPELLYHGTTNERWHLIQQTGGLDRRNRHHVHLTDDLQIARQVGSRHRHETPIVLLIQSQKMWRNGILFFRSENNVWLTDRVPMEYLSIYAPQPH